MLLIVSSKIRIEFLEDLGWYSCYIPCHFSNLSIMILLLYKIKVKKKNYVFIEMSHRLYWQECPRVMSDPLPLSWSSYTQVKYSAWCPVLCEFHRWPLGLLLQGKVSPPSQDIVFLSMVCMEFVLSVFSVSHRKGKKITRLTQKSTEFMLYCFRLLWYWSL